MGYVIMPLEPEYSEYVFQINGVAAVRNYTAQVQGNRIKITSAENETLSLLEADVSEIEIDGTVYTNPIEAQAAINAITYADIPIVVLTSEQRDKIIFKLGEEHAQKNWLLRANGTRVNPESFIPGSSTAWLDMQNEYTVIDFPAMTRGETKVVRIQEPGSNLEVEDGWATVGGVFGVKIGNRAMLICMADSAGGTMAQVGNKYAIVANNAERQQLIGVDTYSLLPEESKANPKALYLTRDTNNLYRFDSQLGDYVSAGSIIEGTLVNPTQFKDSNQNVVVPDGTHFYKDEETDIYYKWDGAKYIEFNSNGGVEAPRRFYGISSNPNSDPISETADADFRFGDYYIESTNGTEQGGYISVWMYVRLSLGDQWIKLAPSASGGSGFMTLNSMNEVTSEWSALYHQSGTDPMLDSIGIGFMDDDTFVISKTASFNLGSNLLFKRSASDGKSTFNIEYWEFNNFSNTYVKSGEFLKSINGNKTFDNGDLYLSEASIWVDDEYKGFNDDYDEEEGPDSHTLNELLQFILSNALLGNKINTATEDFKIFATAIDKAMWLDINSFSFGNPTYITRMESPSQFEMCYNEIGDGNGDNYKQSLYITATNIVFADTRNGYSKDYRIEPVDPENETVYAPHKLGTEGGVIVTSIDGEIANREGKVSLSQEYIINLSGRTKPLVEDEFSENFFQAPYDCKITEIWAQAIDAPTGSSIKLSAYKDGTEYGSTNKYLEIPISQRKSNTNHDIINVTLPALTVIDFKAIQIGSTNPGFGVNVFVKIKKVIS